MLSSLNLSTIFNYPRIENNGIGLEGVKAISRSLKYNNSLKSLILCNNFLGNHKLGNNNIGDEGIRDIAIAMSEGHNFTYLDISKSYAKI